MASLAKSKQASPSPGRLSCSICLEPVESDGEDRSVAKLKCGHQFHLDCIGSAFNAKGAMQCPNCRQVEQGQWLYASGCFPQQNLPGNTGSEDDSDNHVGIHLNLFYLHDERVGPTSARPDLTYHRLPVSHGETEYQPNGYARIHQRALLLLPSERIRWERSLPTPAAVDPAWVPHEVGPLNAQPVLSRMRNGTRYGGSMLPVPNSSDGLVQRQWMDTDVSANALSPSSWADFHRRLSNRGTRDHAFPWLSSASEASRPMHLMAERSQGAIGSLEDAQNRRFQEFGRELNDYPGLRSGRAHPSGNFAEASSHQWGMPPRVNYSQNGMMHMTMPGHASRFGAADSQSRAEGGLRNLWH